MYKFSADGLITLVSCNCTKMSLPVHPLLHLVESNANVLKLILKNYIDFTVDNHFDQLKNSIVELIATGQIGPQSNDSASEYTQTTFASDQSIADTENLPNFHHSNDQLAITLDQITLPSSSLVSPITTSAVTKQECLDTLSITIPINVNCSDAPNDKNKEQSNNADIEVNNAQNGQVTIDEVKEEYDDDDDEGEYMSDCAECEDCVKGICGLVGENADPVNDPHTGLDMHIGLGQDELEDEPNEDNQSTDNANDLSLINQQIRSNQNAIKQNFDNGQSVQPIVENNQQSIGDDQSSGEGKGDKRKSKSNSTSKVVKKVRKQNVEEFHQDEEEEEGKPQVITLKVNCTEDGCKTFSNSVEMWKTHLFSVHGQMPYKHLHDNVRHNQHGQTEYACTECEEVCISQRSLIQHWKMYHLSGKFECSICAFVGNMWCKVHDHYRNYHSPNTIQCTQEGCKKTFPFMYDLKQHQRIHAGNTMYICTWDDCRKESFKHMGNAIGHVRVQHFNLPRTVKKQKELNIIDERDAKVFIQVSSG